MRVSEIALLVTSLSVMASVTACSGMFDVTNPSDLSEELLEDPLLLAALIDAPAAAAAQYYDLAVQAGDLISDDIMQPSTQTGFLLHDVGEFHLFNERTEVLYNNLAAARWRATDATNRLKELLPNPTSHAAIARGYFWDAVIRVTLADMFEQITFDAGPPQSPVAVYQMALELLEQSAEVAKASGDAEYEAAAHATQARVYRSLFFELGEAGQLDRAAEHAALALAADPGFQVDVIIQLPGSQNGIFSNMNGVNLTNLGIGPRFVGLLDPVSGLPEPRVPQTGLLGTSVEGPWYHQLKYASRDSDIPVSRWQEPQLIIAEHSLETGDLASAVENINVVRRAAGLPDFQSSSSAEIREQLIHERRAEFWMELRSWPDSRYYGIVPIRWSDFAVELGLDRRMPISLRERQSNSHFQ